MISRRGFCALGAAALTSALAGCSGPTSDTFMSDVLEPEARRDWEGRTLGHSNYNEIYAAYMGEEFPVLAFNYHQVDQKFLRQTVAYRGDAQPGTIIIDPRSRHLYFIDARDRATRYGVGVGREGFAWHGEAKINMKHDWPDWVPPPEMVRRQPEIVSELEKTPRGLGVRGGPRSPLGARAMYLFGDGRDLGYRIHGTTEPETIGTYVSSGCIRMCNQDIINLYPRVSLGTRVLVLG
jgi:lipoprotein-anchoring transpeptidase ErfK/SrfK